MLITLYYLIILLCVLSFALLIAGWRRFGLAAIGGALIANGAVLLLIFKQAGHISVFNIFESFLFMTFILGCFSVFNRGAKTKIGLWILIEILILLGVSLFFAHEPAPSNYNYEFIYVILFHVFRYVSLALMLYSSAYFVEFIVQREKNERTRALSQQGRNFLLLSTVLFFMSEYIGIIWCQLGWGDFWMWGVTFFQSTFIVLYLMIAFHIPGKGKYSEDIKAIFGGLTGFVVLILTVVRSYF
jgi:hypothetical protein